MDTELKSLKIDRTPRPAPEHSKWARRWIICGVALFLLLGTARLGYNVLSAAPEVETLRVRASTAGPGASAALVLNATGYIVAHHKIEVAAKVIGKVAWIGVEKADRVRQGQVLVRLEDDEYRAQVQQAQGQLANLQARLLQLEHGSRPEEIEVAKANLGVAQADMENARVNLERVKKLVTEGVLAQQALDDAQARYDGQVARVASLQKTHDLARIGPRQEEIDSVRGQVEQARGAVAFAETQLANTVIRAPVTGTILERAVEKGEFVTTSFVGDRGAKGYVVSLADLNDLQVELDIAQNDFAKLQPHQKGIVTTDAFPDRKYEGVIFEISPEANRQKATVQVKVKILKPDEFLRPEMNASVAFIAEEKPAAGGSAASHAIVVPASAVRNDSVFVVVGGRAVRRPVKAGSATAHGVAILQGLIGGEDLIVSPPADLKDGDRVHAKGQ